MKRPLAPLALGKKLDFVIYFTPISTDFSTYREAWERVQMKIPGRAESWKPVSQVKQ